MNQNDTPEKKTEGASTEIETAGRADNTSARPASRWKFGRGVYGSKDVPIRALDTFIVCVIAAIVILAAVGTITGGFRVQFDTGVADLSVPVQKVRYGNMAQEPETPLRPGYTLEGWSTDAQETKPWSFAYNAVKEDMTLYAIWAPAAVTVKFDLAGGTLNGAETADSITVTYGESYGMLPIPEKEGSTFAGWSYSGQNITADSTVTMTGEHVLTATWQ